MKANLLIFRNELKSKHPPRYKVVGIVVEVVLSKELFAKNKDVIPFIKEVFQVEFKDYVISSRTNIISRLSRIIISSNQEDYLTYKNKLNEYIRANTKEYQNTKNSLDSWRF